jgi:hypothetical protein
MNIRRGLWRAWIFVTVLWIIGASALAFVVLPDNVARKYQYIYNMREDVGDPNSVDWTKDFYALMQSPSRNMLPAAFDILAYQHVASSDGDVKKGRMIAVDFPDRSRLYMSAQMTKDDQNSFEGILGPALETVRHGSAAVYWRRTYSAPGSINPR